jgi:ribosomal protein S18 acetylase RimI-like enzyme
VLYFPFSETTPIIAARGTTQNLTSSAFGQPLKLIWQAASRYPLCKFGNALNVMPSNSPSQSTIALSGKDAVRIRLMTIDDFPKVFHIGEEIFTADYSQSLYRTWDEYEITTLFNSDSELCLVAEAESEILGFALATTVKKHHSPWKYGYLIWLGVSNHIQHGGVGTALFKDIKRRMKEQGVRMMMIDTSADNQAAIGFFYKQGFDDIQEHVYMNLNLSRKKKKPARKKP